MSNSLASQWIRPTFLDLVGASDMSSEAKSTSSRRPAKQRPHIAKPKAVQVIGSNETMRTLTISDSFHSITGQLLSTTHSYSHSLRLFHSIFNK